MVGGRKQSMKYSGRVGGIQPRAPDGVRQLSMVDSILDKSLLSKGYPSVKAPHGHLLDPRSPGQLKLHGVPARDGGQHRDQLAFGLKMMGVTGGLKLRALSSY